MRFAFLLVLPLLLSASVAAAQSPEAPLFTDTYGYPYQNALAYVKQRGIVSGYEDGSFRPEFPVNRAEFVKMLVGARYGQESLAEADGGGLFLDVRADQWFAPYVAVAKEKSLIDGYADGTFGPGRNITFVEAAKILARSFDVAGLGDGATNPWYRQYVTALEAAAAIPPDVAFFDQPLTRGELAEMLRRLGLNDRDQRSLSYADLESWSTYVRYRDPASRVFVDYPSVWEAPFIPPRRIGYPDLWLGGTCQNCADGRNAFRLYVKIYEGTGLTSFDNDGIWAREDVSADGNRIVIMDLPSDCSDRSAIMFLDGKVVEVSGFCLGDDLRMWNAAYRILQTLTLNL